MNCLLVAIVLAAPAPKEPAKPAAEKNLLVGEWVVASHVSSGKPIPNVGKPERVTITEDRWKVFVQIGAESCPSVDSSKDPPHIDIWVPSQEVENRARGIYKLEGDMLTVCYRLDGARPTKFESLPRLGNWMMTLKRTTKD